MKKRNGFTLIELLAVIVILAVIALIATPLITNTISKARTNANRESVRSYLNAVEETIMEELVQDPNASMLNGHFNILDHRIIGKQSSLNISYKGNLVLGEMNFNENKINYGQFQVNNDKFLYQNGELTLIDDPKIKIYNIGDVIYFNPVTGMKCSKDEAWTSSNTSSQCYGWNVLRTNKNHIEMMMDHNYGNKIAWDSSENAQTGPKEVMVELKRITDTFKNVETYTADDNKTMTIGTDSYTINYEGYKGRLIGMDEIINIDQIKNFTGSGDFISVNTPWLYQNISYAGYWTDQAVKIGNGIMKDAAWTVYYDHTLHSAYAKNTGIYGVRPVIRILKSRV